MKSYISAVKAVLADIYIEVNEDRCLLNSLMRACRLTKDTYSVKTPIQRQMLDKILNTTYDELFKEGQPYLAHLYAALFSTAYYGLFRVGELTESDHAVKVGDVEIGTNKNKIKFTLRSSKTHGKYTCPQSIKISKNLGGEDHCPFQILRNYLAQRPKARNYQENFFIFKDGSPVTPYHFHSKLKSIITIAGYDPEEFSTHCFRSGRAVDLFNLGVSVETIKKIGRWKSNAVYVYLK